MLATGHYCVYRDTKPILNSVFYSFGKLSHAVLIEQNKHFEFLIETSITFSALKITLLYVAYVGPIYLFICPNAWLISDTSYCPIFFLFFANNVGLNEKQNNVKQFGNFFFSI